MPRSRWTPVETPIDTPPPRVVGAARTAFRDASTTHARLRPLHDSLDPRRGARSLVLGGPDVRLLMTCRIVPGGVRVGGRLTGTPTAPRVVLYRPGRPCLRLAVTPDLQLRPATVPRGLASVVVEHVVDGESVRWESDWLRL